MCMRDMIRVVSWVGVCEGFSGGSALGFISEIEIAYNMYRVKPADVSGPS
jgi:hypothetical protein